MKRFLRTPHKAALLLAFLCIPFLSSCRDVPKYALTTAVSPAGSGTVAANPADGPYAEGAGVQLSATALPGFVFHHWEGDLGGSVNPALLTIAGAATVTAVFVSDGAPTHALTTAVSPAGAGAVVADPPNGPYTEGTVLQVSAPAYAGFWFHHWEGALAGTANPASLTIMGPATVTAVFLAVSTVTHPLATAVSPAGAGIVVADPPDGPYPDGTEVQLAATALAGFVFHHWEGDLSGTVSPALLTITGPAIVTAVFLPNSMETHTLSVSVSPVGSGTVSADPPDGPYPVGTEVQVTAAALPGFVFDHWEGDLTGNGNPAVKTITDLTIATAVFVPDSWAKTFGGAGSDEAYDIQATSDGGYIVAGQTNSSGAGGLDMYLVKLDARGNKSWAKTYGGAGTDSAKAVRQTADGGYILAGQTNSYGAGGYDFYVVKTNAAGTKQWAETYGGAGGDYASDILVGSGGYYIFGTTSTGGTDMSLKMIGFTGNVLGSKTYGGAGVEAGEAIAPVNGGGCVLAGWTSSYGAGAVDAYLLKVNSAGEEVWSETYGGTGSDYANAVVQRSAGWGYVLAGNTVSAAPFGDDMFTALVAEDGYGLWRAVGWNKEEYARAVAAVSDGGHVLAGNTNSIGAGARDVHLVKITGSNYREWEKSFGGTNNDGAEAVVVAPDGGYVLAGYTESFGAGGRDMYVVKTNVEGNAPSVPAD
jgi:hypothetical protein